VSTQALPATTGPGRGKGSAGAVAKPKPRDPQEIEAELAASRDRLAANVEELSRRLQPATIVAGAKQKARVRAEEGVVQVRRMAGLPVAGEPQTGPRPEFVGALAGAGVAVVLLVAFRRR
jgi:hypothetical protein